jgi:hypothetical protein
LCLGLFWIFHWFEHQFVPNSCVQGVCVAAGKKERGRKNKRKKIEEVPAIQKNLLLKRKVLAAETKERKERTKDKRERKVSISDVVLSLFVYFVWLYLCLSSRL